MYPLGVSFGAESLMSLKRIEGFLLEEEKNEGETNVKRRNSVITINENGQYPSNEQLIKPTESL